MQNKKIHELFNDPFFSEKSIQLNNKYWPSSTFKIINLLKDCEKLLIYGDSKDRRPLFFLSKCFPSEELYKKMLRRFGKIMSYQSNFGFERVDLVGDDIIQGVKGSGEEILSQLSKIESFRNLRKKVRRKYCSEYGWDFSLVHNSIRFADANDVFKRQMKEFGLLSEYHNDELKGVTCVVYLSRVSRDNGAFSFIEGSEKIPRSPLLSAIHQTVCFDMGLTDWGRMEFLPLEFRSTPMVGNFLEDEKVKAFMNNEIVLEGGAGCAIMFNGQKLIHRGGKPIVGSRCAAFIAIEGILAHKIRTLISISRF